jgi:hypothetical protein
MELGRQPVEGGAQPLGPSPCVSKALVRACDETLRMVEVCLAFNF